MESRTRVRHENVASGNSDAVPRVVKRSSYLIAINRIVNEARSDAKLSYVSTCKNTRVPWPDKISYELIKYHRGIAREETSIDRWKTVNRKRSVTVH